MDDCRSNSSYTLTSIIQFNSRSLNPLDSMHPLLISKIKKEADSYIGCSKKCLKIWEALSKNDIAGSFMTQNVMQVIFKEFQKDLSVFLRVSSVKEFMKLFDQDKDGNLNLDEQISIFSFIKERLELIAHNCLEIQAYSKFQSLMKEVRELQANIAKWQSIMRQKIHKQQLQSYKKKGQNKIILFCDKFDEEYEKLQQNMIQRKQNFEKQVFYEIQALQARLNQPSEYLKIKPRNSLKQLQFQQKLVSLEERVYEALDFRRQLNILQKKQKERVDTLMQEHAQKERKILRTKHQKQRKELSQKLEQLENKLFIKMKKELDILQKQNTLHEIEIKRLQGLEKKWAKKKGIYEPELKRRKKLQKQRNQVLSESKKCKQKNIVQIQEENNEPMSKFNPQRILLDTIKFKLTNKSSEQMPVNIKSLTNSTENIRGKVSKYIQPKKNEKTYSLCKFYDFSLEEQEQKPIINQQILQQEKKRKHQFMVSKLL